MRIVSLLPSATEILCALDLGDQLVGISHECDYPPEICHLPTVTSSRITKDASSAQIDQEVREHLSESAALYNLDMAMLANLKPDLLVTQALCDVCAVSADDVNDAAQTLICCPDVINLEPMSLQDVFDTMMLVGDKTGHRSQAEEWLSQARKRVAEVVHLGEKLEPKPIVAFLEWLDPLFNAGHWTPELIELAGGKDCLGNLHKPSRTITHQELTSSEPEVLIIGLCGFGIERAREEISAQLSKPDWLDLPCVQNNQVYLVDGDWYFNRPGPRLVDSLELLASILHPEKFQLSAEIRPAQHYNLEKLS
jgi:iron complex transport system substrate-binding protein